jgi:hypothetical protein
LLSLPINTAWDIFCSLNELLADHDVWRSYDRQIRKKLKSKFNEEEAKKEKLYDVMEKVANKPTKYIDKFLNSGAYYDNDGATIIPSMDKNKVEHPYLVAEAND